MSNRRFCRNVYPCYRQYEMNYSCYDGKMYGFCSFRELIILILILLQFGRKKSLGNKTHEEQSNYSRIDDEILFIITLYFISCCF